LCRESLKERENGNSCVIGLINVAIRNEEGRFLHEPPPIPGYYLHREQLSDEELQQVTKL
jgi:hypothetical protein